MFFALSRYRVTLQAQTAIGFLNGDVGTTLREAFGTTLRQIVCIYRYQECARCPVRRQCVFATVFSPVNDPYSIPRRLTTPPRGFVIKPPLDANTFYAAGETMVFDFLLIGRLSDYLPYAIVPFAELGRRGIGTGRGTFSLAAIDAIKSDGALIPVYKDSDGIVQNTSAMITADDVLRLYPVPANGRVTLNFLTPTCIRVNPTGAGENSRPVRVPEFLYIACRLRDRISALCREYGPTPLDVDFKGFGIRARKVRTVQSKLRWVEATRENRARHGHDLGGFVGEITFEGNLAEFWPFLVFGQYVHVGDNAVFGRGWYEIEKTG